MSIEGGEAQGDDPGHGVEVSVVVEQKQVVFKGGLGDQTIDGLDTPLKKSIKTDVSTRIIGPLAAPYDRMPDQIPTGPPSPGGSDGSYGFPHFFQSRP